MPVPKNYRRPGNMNPYYKSNEWISLRGKVLRRDKGTCQYCGEVGVQADHVMPRSAGGPDALSNLVCCCVTCNKIAGGVVFKNFNDKKKHILQIRANIKKQKKDAKHQEKLLRRIRKIMLDW